MEMNSPSENETEKMGEKKKAHATTRKRRNVGAWGHAVASPKSPVNSPVAYSSTRTETVLQPC
jgi:hypothetical protein